MVEGNGNGMRVAIAPAGYIANPLFPALRDVCL
jgi:hypothetical protein